MDTMRGHRRTRRASGPRRLASRIPLRLKASSSIAAAEYNRNRRTLRVRFSPGGVYDYLDVPAGVVQKLLNASSLGQFVNWHIKPHYRYVRVA
jgi:hypothetical protein